MSTPIISQTTNKAGLCPHGLPPAACPICSGGGMGGAKKMDNTPIKTVSSGEWSWMKCYAAGLAMRAQERISENVQDRFLRQIEFAKQLGKEIQKLADKIQTAIENFKNLMPDILKPAVNFIANIIINPILNLISLLPKAIEKFAQFGQNLQSFINNAAEKLVSVLGEFKNFIQKKITEPLKKKIKSFLSLFISEFEDENYQNDDTLAVFKARELKKFLIKIIKINKKRNGNANRTNKT